jgi:hypothetical protein
LLLSGIGVGVRGIRGRVGLVGGRPGSGGVVTGRIGVGMRVGGFGLGLERVLTSLRVPRVLTGRGGGLIGFLRVRGFLLGGRLRRLRPGQLCLCRLVVALRGSLSLAACASSAAASAFFCAAVCCSASAASRFACAVAASCFALASAVCAVARACFTVAACVAAFLACCAAPAASAFAWLSASCAAVSLNAA